MPGKQCENKKNKIFACRISISGYICTPQAKGYGNRPNAKGNINAKVAQLVEHDLAKVGVASSNLVFRSNPFQKKGFIVKG